MVVFPVLHLEPSPAVMIARVRVRPQQCAAQHGCSLSFMWQYRVRRSYKYIVTRAGYAVKFLLPTVRLRLVPREGWESFRQYSGRSFRG